MPTPNRRLLLAIAVSAVAGCAGAPAIAPPAAVPTGVTWEWVELVTPVETVRVDDPAGYTLRLDDGDRVALRADCNRATGTATFAADGTVAFKPMAMTRAMCPPGSLSDRYVRELSRGARWFVKDGALFVDLPLDSGALRFRRAAAP